MSRASKTSKLPRYAFLAAWFFLAPLALSVATIWLLGPAEDAVLGDGLLDLVRRFVDDQPIPAVIVLFTLYEMILYSMRHSLPFADRIGLGGRTDLPPDVRREFEAAAHLLDEAERILAKRKRAVQRHLPTSVREELGDALDDLREEMNGESFDKASFEDAFDAARTKVERHLGRWRKSELREYTESILVAVAVALFLRAFVVEAFKIPSGSMLPTLQIHDHIFVNKFKYGPSLPRSKQRLFSSLPPARGDVIVFETPDPGPNAEGQDFIKRVIALPGDELRVENGRPIINGWLVPRCEVGLYHFREGDEYERCGELSVEFLGTATYLVQMEVDCDESGFSRGQTGRQGPYTVAPGEVWVFGDNRNNSSDSRAWFGGRGGGVPFANIKGRAMFVWFSPNVERLLVNVMGRPRLPKGVAAEVVAKVDECVQKRPPLSSTTPPSPTASP